MHRRIHHKAESLPGVFCIRHILAILILVTAPSVSAHAEELLECPEFVNGKVANHREVVSRYLNVDGNIANIAKPQNGNEKENLSYWEHYNKWLEGKAHEWKGTRICFGRWGEQAVVYRVLDPLTTDYSGENQNLRTMLLDCDVSLRKLPYMKDEEADPFWEGSYVREWLNGEEFLYNEECFTGPESDAIIDSVKPEALDSDSAKVSITRDSISGPIHYRYLQFTPLTKDKVFLLDSKELTNVEYGYNSAGVDIEYTDIEWTNKAKILYDAEDGYYRKSPYWLRTNGVQEFVVYESYAEYNDFVSCNKYGNFVTGSSEKDGKGVSPALNLDLSHILFTASDNEDYVYLTLRNGTSVTRAELGDADNKRMGMEGGFVPLKNIRMEGKYQLKPDGLWALVADAKGKVYSCERIADAVQGESFVRIREGLQPGEYLLYVFYGTKGFPTSYACMDPDERMEFTITEDEEAAKPPYYTYVVKEGDCLWQIADRFCEYFFDSEYGDDMDQNAILCKYLDYLQATNQDVVKDPNYIETGMELKLYETPEYLQKASGYY